MADDLALPSAYAELIAELARPVTGRIEKTFGGRWIVRDAEDGLLLLAPDLSVVARFPIPGRFVESGWFNHDISPDGRFASFAGTRHTVCVRADGSTVWEVRHPALGDVDGDDVPACAVFAPGGAELWAFVPVPDEEWDEDADVTYTARRWVITLPDGVVTGTSPSYYQGPHKVLIHPDGRHVSSAEFDGSSDDGRWTRWDADGQPTTPARGFAVPLDAHAEAAGWLANAFGTLRLHDFGPSDGDNAARDPRVESSASSFLWAWFLDRGRVLALSDTEPHHVLLTADTLEPLARIHYPDSYDSADHVHLCGAGDGSWVTVTSRVADDPPRVCRWRVTNPAKDAARESALSATEARGGPQG
ncbi:hypothetical protein OG292_28030 [Streptomyces sp. NBC_01511]|uniref:hypothetical protein n=1 Tax=Streptomyces sp. NBC_01511 TaxID=2903889 RepID=UPI00386ECB4C